MKIIAACSDIVQTEIYMLCRQRTILRFLNLVVHAVYKNQLLDFIANQFNKLANFVP